MSRHYDRTNEPSVPTPAAIASGSSRPRASSSPSTASTSTWIASPAGPGSASAPSTATSPNKEDLLQALADERFAGFADSAREALKDRDPWNGFCTLIRESAKVTAEDRALSEAMDQLPGLCRAAAEKAELNQLAAELVEGAKASGAMRADFTADDIPSIMCGLARATASRQDGPPPMSWERYLEIILAGLRPPASDPTD